MKFFYAYWIIGTLLYGIAAANHRNACPLDRALDDNRAISVAATWPSVLTYILFVDRLPSTPACENK